MATTRCRSSNTVSCSSPKGMKHQHVNTGREPLWLVFVYGPHGQVPAN
jgi:oxalate decarboxylase/phosphoglucose isomerase-like protein (cupin superfamily)